MITDERHSSAPIISCGGLPSQRIADVRRRLQRANIGDLNREKHAALKELLFDFKGRWDPLFFTTMDRLGSARMAHELASALDIDPSYVADFLAQAQECERAGVLLTGSEVISLICEEQGVSHVLAYPGTSELALCADIVRLGSAKLINGRGDTESAFIAAGLCLLEPARAVAILHGARGATNAIGALAVARRNEIGYVCLVGLPTTTSQPFLPPHAEPDLIAGLVHFAKAGWELPGPTPYLEDRPDTFLDAGSSFIARVREAFNSARTLPFGPVVIGLPQDVAERAWIPFEAWAKRGAVVTPTAREKPTPEVSEALRLLNRAKFPLFLIDDQMFRSAGAKNALVTLVSRCSARVLQVPYRRGPMLFEQMHRNVDLGYLGVYDPHDQSHSFEMSRADLLITVEDRNMYPRVIGPLPDIPKLSLTSNPAKTCKNGYLKAGDIQLVGDVATLLCALDRGLNQDVQAQAETVLPGELPEKASKECGGEKFRFLRCDIASILGQVLKQQDTPIVVDDSQMFGGMLARGYSEFPQGTRVFGDHSGFVGGGLGHAVGVALAQPGEPVWCLVGDQAFTNGLQALVCAGEQRVNLKILLCDNGGSVSLRKQALADDPESFDRGENAFLGNSHNFDYVALARSMGLATLEIVYNPNSEDIVEREPQERFATSLVRAKQIAGPVLLRLSIPSTPDAWEGVWATRGLETHTGVLSAGT